MQVCRCIALTAGAAAFLWAGASDAADAANAPTKQKQKPKTAPVETFAVAAGPLAQIGGPVPSLYHAGGMINLTIRKPTTLADFGTVFAVAVVPEERFRAPMRGFHAAIFGRFCWRPWDFLGLCGGARVIDLQGWNETPSGPMEHKSFGPAGTLGAEFYWRFAEKLAFRIYAEGGYSIARPTLRVDARYDQIWGPPFPVFGILTTQIIYDIFQNDREVDTR